MLTNYHTHTARCGHAIGTERAYIENAIRSGIRILGFSDHAPQFFSNGYVSTMRMTPQQAPDYVATLRGLAAEYQDQIELRIGFEAEYFPASFARLQALCRSLGVSYLLLGQHCLDDEPDGLWTGRPTEDPALLVRYVDQVLSGLSTGSFSYLAHPDVFNFTGDPAFYSKEMTRLCVGAKALSIPLEVNLLGYSQQRAYPSERFFKIAADVGNDLVIGCDAHDPAALSDLAMQEATRRFAERFGCPIKDNVLLRKI